jgi:UDP:flavonoid glycosyltransferase YjiC (YdhE family)
VFAYLKPSGPHFEAVLGAIINAGCQAAVFAPGVSREQVARYRSPAIQFSRVPFNIERAAGGADVAVCHAGHDTTLACLLAGTPTLLIPLQMEQLITARRVEEQGAGVVLGQNTLSQCTEQLQRLVAEASFRDSAKGMAARYPAAKPPQSVEAVIAHCGELVAIG